jgi:membrane-anchored glycerophosphoryl diester phosphodiesterase (GDPDase)
VVFHAVVSDLIGKDFLFFYLERALPMIGLLFAADRVNPHSDALIVAIGIFRVQSFVAIT